MQKKFPDGKIAKNFAYCRTKSTQIIKRAMSNGYIIFRANIGQLKPVQ